MNWALHIENLKKGEIVSFRPKGNSMNPKIKSGNLVTVSPDVTNLQKDDVVFCKVKGNYYVHLIIAEKQENGNKQYLIGNNHGGTNGWVSISAIYGRVIKVED